MMTSPLKLTIDGVVYRLVPEALTQEMIDSLHGSEYDFMSNGGCERCQNIAGYLYSDPVEDLYTGLLDVAPSPTIEQLVQAVMSMAVVCIVGHGDSRKDLADALEDAMAQDIEVAE